MRKLPGALGHEESAVEESFSEALEGAPEYPHYTRPFDWRGHAVPDVLLSGDHARIREWRLERSRERGHDCIAAPRATPALAPAGPDCFATIARHARRLSPVAFFVPMSGVIDSIERAQLRRVPSFQAGDRVRVHFQVVEGTRRRTQVFEGIVIKRQGSGVRETFTVRKQSFGVGVERTFPVHSPKIERIEVAARGDVRRAKLYYLRERVGRALAGARAPLDGRRGGHRAGSRGGRRDAAGRRARARARRSSASRWPRPRWSEGDRAPRRTPRAEADGRRGRRRRGRGPPRPPAADGRGRRRRAAGRGPAADDQAS